MQPSSNHFTNRIPWFLKPKILGLAVLIGFVLLFVVVGVGFLTRQEPAQAIISTPLMNVILAPSSTPFIHTPTADGISANGTIGPENSVGKDIVLNAYVQIFGTGGDGLRFRDAPGLSGQVKFVASEAEIFIVKDGPTNMDGYTWWYLVGPFDESRDGWAVSNFLILSQTP